MNGLLLGAGFVLASLPFIRAQHAAYWRLLEFIAAYAAFVVLGRGIEANVGQNAAQGWAFYAVTFLLFVVAAFPAFAWRFLWKK